MSQQKRKSVDADFDDAEEPDKKKLKVTQSVENEATATANGTDVNDTQEYDMDGSGNLDYKNDCVDKESGESSKTNDKSVEPVQKPETEDVEALPTTSENGIDSKSSLKPIESVQVDAKLVSEVVGGLDFEKIYEKVLKYRKEKNRVEIVSNQIIDGVGNGNAPDNAIDDNLFKELSNILAMCPDADPSKVYDMLVSDQAEDGRASRVLKLVSNPNITHSIQDGSQATNAALSEKSGRSDKLLNGPFSDPSFKNNPLYKDMKTLMKVLPDKDPNEVYAFLEAHFDEPNRVQVVIDELTASDSQESLPMVREASVEDTDRGKAPMSVEEKLMADLKQLKEIFRDCDPNFLHEKLNENASLDRVQVIAAELFENKSYPKLNDVIDEEKTKEWKKKVTSLDFDINTFLKKFPEPVDYFMDTTYAVNDNYKEHVLVYVKNTYPSLKDGYIKKVLVDKNHHLAPAIQVIEEELQEIMLRPSKKKRDEPRKEFLLYPDKPDEPFFQEVIFVCNRQLIIDHLKDEAELRKLKVETARSHGELIECGCCYDDECLFEEMAACADGHIFCKECIRRSCETAIGEAKTKFPCLTGTCELEFPLPVLQELLSPTTFSLALRKMQEEELRLADISDLVSCPYCSFATIMPDPDDKVFKCMNTECLKESCRLCKEPNHVPLKCSEVEKQCATNMRTYIEMKVSEAMLRVCQDCTKRFYKDYGCNKMTCTCGASMCYVCRAPNIDYSHFDDESNQCELYTDATELHDAEMTEAVGKAKEEYLRDHPDQDPGPDFDSEKMLEELKKSWALSIVGGDGEDYDSDDDANDDSDDGN